MATESPGNWYPYSEDTVFDSRRAGIDQAAWERDQKRTASLIARPAIRQTAESDPDVGRFWEMLKERMNNWQANITEGREQ